MNYYDRKLVTVICEAFLEEKIVELAKKHGIHGYTTMDARGEGARGLRDGDFEYSKNVKLEILCEEMTANKFCEDLQSSYFEDYAVVVYLENVKVLREDKFN